MLTLDFSVVRSSGQPEFSQLPSSDVPRSLCPMFQVQEIQLMLRPFEAAPIPKRLLKAEVQSLKRFASKTSIAKAAMPRRTTFAIDGFGTNRVSNSHGVREVRHRRSNPASCKRHLGHRQPHLYACNSGQQCQVVAVTEVPDAKHPALDLAQARTK